MLKKIAFLVWFLGLQSFGFCASPDFFVFDKLAQQGKPLSVVFFGGSLTWGANSSDPQRTSYRGRTMTWLQQKYPNAAFRFHDAAIGGTGSDLGMFRLERDVLKYKPDLVFLDFTVNDNARGQDTERLASYESILRTLIRQEIPVIQVILGVADQFGAKYNLEEYYRRTAHLKLAEAYGTGVVDLYPVMQAALTGGAVTLKDLYPFDGTHPDDPGYEVFFQAVKKGFENAVAERRQCMLPDKPVFSDKYKKRQRTPLRDLTLPDGWQVTKTHRTSLWFDGLSSRWMGDVVMADAKNAGNIKPFTIDFEGTFVGLIGEGDQSSLSARITIDGEIQKQGEGENAPAIWKFDTAKFSPKGNLFKWTVLSKALKPGKHTLEITPYVPAGKNRGQLRIESICSAGEASRHMPE